MTALVDGIREILDWSVSDRIAAAALAFSVVAGLWAVLIRRSDRKQARIASAPDVAATFARVPVATSDSREVPEAERLTVTLENIGASPAYDVECSCVAMWDPESSAAHLFAHDVSIPHIGSGDKLPLRDSRAPRLEWDQRDRRWDDVPFAILEYTISFSDRTHRYTNSYLVSVFGYPDQISDDAENEAVVRTTRHRSSPLNAGRTLAFIQRRWDLLMRPLRKRKFRRMLARQGDDVTRQSARSP